MSTKGEENVRDEEPRRTEESKRFEANLRRLLRSSYHPPEPRAEFRDDLFSRLQTRQQENIVARKRTRRIRVLKFGSAITALAASIALVIGVLPNTLPANTMHPAPNNGVTVAEATGHGVDQNVMPVLDAIINGTVETRATDNAQWTSASGRQEFTRPTCLRASLGQARVDLQSGARLMLDRNAELVLDNGRLKLNHGRLQAFAADANKPLRLRLPEHDIVLQPGALVELALQSGDNFAPGGAPAPDVTVLKGKATVESRTSQAAEAHLLAGRRYLLHDYSALENLKGERLDESLFQNPSRWVQPQLVDYTTIRESK